MVSTEDIVFKIETEASAKMELSAHRYIKPDDIASLPSWFEKMFQPFFDHDLRLLRAVEDLTIEQFVAQLFT